MRRTKIEEALEELVKAAMAQLANDRARQSLDGNVATAAAYDAATTRAELADAIYRARVALSEIPRKEGR